MSGSVANENSWQKLGTDVRGYDPIPFFLHRHPSDIGNTKPSFFIEGQVSCNNTGISGLTAIELTRLESSMMERTVA